MCSTFYNKHTSGMDCMKIYIGKFPIFGTLTSILTRLVWRNKAHEPVRYIKIDEQDTWSMDVTLAHIVYPLLLQLRLNKTGAPFVDMCDRPEHLIGTIPDPWEIDEFHHQAFDWVLTEMIYAFKSKTVEFAFDDVLQRDATDAHLEHYAKVDNGFRLFGRYYNNLWD